MSEQVTVSVSDDHLNGIDALADRLRAEGMRVEQVLATVGVITGSVPADRLPALSAIPGVAAVERSTEFRLPPPGSDLQ